jgi:hypothetical protein
MENFVRKLVKVKNRKLSKQIIGLAGVAWSFKFGSMNSNIDPY